MWLPYFERKDRVLDIGCHNGQRDFKLAPYVEHITAFDYDETMLAQARAWGTQNGVTNIEFLELSAEEKLPFPDHSFDKILFLDVLEHLYNREQIMRECRRVLKPGGKMIVTIPNTETTWKKFQRSAGMNSFSDPDHKIEYSEQEIRAVHKEAGFTIVEVHPIVYDFPLNGLIDFTGGINLWLYRHLAAWRRDAVKQHPEETIGFMVISNT